MKKLKVIGLTLLLATGGVIGIAAPAQAAGVSVSQACAHQWQGSSVVLVANNVYGWKCRFTGTGGSYVDESVSILQECIREYGNSYHATYSDYNNPYSWQCVL